MKKRKKIIIIVSVIIIVIGIVTSIFLFTGKNNKKGQSQESTEKLKALPKPEITGGSRGELGIDKNINESTIDEYLNREDAVYRDMRMLEDPANYEAIGGDRYLSGFIKGFEVVSLPYIIPVTNLPEEVGETYQDETLFSIKNGTYIPNYVESLDIIEYYFPKDKIIFLMCGGGGYAGMMKNFLVSMGWDEEKIYNVGGFWYYNGKNKVEVPHYDDDEYDYYDYSVIPYHYINFDVLTKTNKSSTYKHIKELKINTSKLELYVDGSFALNAIILPNEATNKNIEWISSDEAVAQVTALGHVRAFKEGKATITARSIDGNKIVTCEVTVKKRSEKERVVLDDISSELKEFVNLDINKLYDDYYNKIYNSDGSYRPEYHYIDSEGNDLCNDLCEEEYNKYENNVAKALSRRTTIFNQLLESKKSFVTLIGYNECDERTYSIVDGAKKILSQNNIQFLEVADEANGDTTLSDSKFDYTILNGSSIAIFKEGTLYASIDPNIDAIKDDKELKNWLSNYVKID